MKMVRITEAIDPDRPESPTARQARIRAEYKLDKASDVEPEVEEPENGKPHRLDEVTSVEEPTRKIDEQDMGAAERECMRLAVDVGVLMSDPHWQELSQRHWQDATQYWGVVKGWLVGKQNQQRAAREREAAKKAKQADLSEASVVPEVTESASRLSVDAAAKELAEIQAGIHGSPNSPSNKKRRAELRAQIRR
ncbi:MAG: hypothetical protein ABIJ57_03675 [Pseudomonadota bacterium]